MRPCTEEEVRTLLPIQAYSQKQAQRCQRARRGIVPIHHRTIRNELNRVERQASDRAERIPSDLRNAPASAEPYADASETGAGGELTNGSSGLASGRR